MLDVPVNCGITPVVPVPVTVPAGKSAVVIALYVGAPEPPDDGPAKKSFCPAADKLKLNAGVVVAVATEVVNSGLRFPELNEVTVPEPAEPFDAAVSCPCAFTVILALV